MQLTRLAKCSARCRFLFLSLWMNAWSQIWNYSCPEIKGGIRNTIPSTHVEFLVIFKGGRFLLKSKYLCLCLQDPIPPELVHVLQNSKDPLLQKLFPVTEGNQNNIKPQNRAAVVTVVSKFKVHPIQVSVFYCCLHNWMRNQYRCTRISKCC